MAKLNKKEVKVTPSKEETNVVPVPETAPDNFIGYHTNENPLTTDDVKEYYVKATDTVTIGIINDAPTTQSYKIEGVIGESEVKTFINGDEVIEPNIRPEGKPNIWDATKNETSAPLTEAEFHDQESDVQEKPRVHRQDIVNIANVIHEAFGAWNRANGRYEFKSWDEDDDRTKQGLIQTVEDVIHGIPFISDDPKSTILFNSIVNALK